MSHSQQLCLKWNNHTNIINDLKNFLSMEAMVDVTLACDGLSLKAHKIILSACSPFFKSLFLENPCQHPIVIMKDMKYSDLKAIIEFMYLGEVSVAEDQIASLIKTAQALNVKGLGDVESENSQLRDEPKNQFDVAPQKLTVVESTNLRFMQNQSANCQSNGGDYETQIKREVLSDDLDYIPISNASTLPLQSLSENPSNNKQDEQPPKPSSLPVSSNHLSPTLLMDSFSGPSCQSPLQSSLKLDQNFMSCSVPLARLDVSSGTVLVSNERPRSSSVSPHKSLPMETELETNPVKCETKAYNSSDSDSSSIPDKIKNSERNKHVLKFHKCSKCSFKTLDFSNFKKHAEKKHFKCDECNYITTFSAHLQKHVAAVHNHRLDFSCSLCPFKGITYCALKIHITTVHEGEKPFKCQECDYHASRKTNIERHVIAVHEKRRDYACPTCSHKSADRSNLRKHIRRKHEN